MFQYKCRLATLVHLMFSLEHQVWLDCTVDPCVWFRLGCLCPKGDHSSLGCFSLQLGKTRTMFWPRTWQLPCQNSYLFFMVSWFDHGLSMTLFFSVAPAYFGLVWKSFGLKIITQRLHSANVLEPLKESWSIQSLVAYGSLYTLLGRLCLLFI